MKSREQLVAELAKVSHPLRQLVDEHVRFHRGLLPHVLFGELTPYVVDLHLRANAAGHASVPYSELQRILELLDEAYEKDGPGVGEVIDLSFLLRLPRPGEAGSGIRDHLGPLLRRALLEIEEG